MSKPKHAISRAEPKVWPERVWQTWRTVLLVPTKLDRPADRMPVFVCVTSCGMNRAYAVTFSLS